MLQRRPMRILLLSLLFSLLLLQAPRATWCAPRTKSTIAEALPFLEVPGEESLHYSNTTSVFHLWRDGVSGLRILEEDHVGGEDPVRYYITSVLGHGRQLRLQNESGPVLYQIDYHMLDWTGYHSFHDPSGKFPAVQMFKDKTTSFHARYFYGHDGWQYRWEQTGFNAMQCIQLPTRRIVASYTKYSLALRKAGDLLIFETGRHLERLLIATAWTMDRLWTNR